VDIIDLQGQHLKDEIGRLGNYLPKRYDLLELINGIVQGSIDCRNFHENRMREERRYVDFTDKKPAVRAFYGREREMSMLSNLLTSETKRMLVINGIRGSGRPPCWPSSPRMSGTAPTCSGTRCTSGPT
jgi:hypothetical protein